MLPHLGHLNKHSATSFKVMEYSSASSCIFLLASATLGTSLGPRLGGRIVGPREPKTQFRELDTCYNLSSFLEGIMEMADIDIDPFGDHDKTDAQPDETGKTIPLNPRGIVVVGGGATWEP